MTKKIFNIFNRPETVAAPTGDRYDKQYQMRIDENGHKSLHEVGKTDRYEKIQSHKEETDIKNIIAKATLDPTVLNQKAGQYMDTTNMPTTLAEAQTKILDIKNEFNELPLEIRKKFDNSAEKYIAAYGTKEWAESVGLINEKVVEEIKAVPEEPKSEEM